MYKYEISSLFFDKEVLRLENYEISFKKYDMKQSKYIYLCKIQREFQKLFSLNIFLKAVNIIKTKNYFEFIYCYIMNY